MCWAWLLLKVRLRQSRVNASSLLWSLFIRITRPQLFDHLVCRRCHPINDCTVMMGQLSGMKIPLFAFGRLGNHCAHESVCPSLHSRATQLRRTGASSTLNRRRGVRKGRGRASSFEPDFQLFLRFVRLDFGHSKSGVGSWWIALLLEALRLIKRKVVRQKKLDTRSAAL